MKESYTRAKRPTRWSCSRWHLFVLILLLLYVQGFAFFVFISIFVLFSWILSVLDFQVPSVIPALVLASHLPHPPPLRLPLIPLLPHRPQAVRRLRLCAPIVGTRQRSTAAKKYDWSPSSCKNWQLEESCSAC